MNHFRFMYVHTRICANIKERERKGLTVRKRVKRYVGIRCNRLSG